VITPEIGVACSRACSRRLDGSCSRSRSVTREFDLRRLRQTWVLQASPNGCVLNRGAQHLPDWRALMPSIRRYGSGTVL
jgi:hypothetical protein